MKSEVKQALIECLREHGAKQLNPIQQYPVQKMLLKKLGHDFPLDQNGSAKFKKITGLSKLDFELPNYTTEYKWSSGYKHTTVGSLIHNLHSHTKPRKYVSGQELSEIIEMAID